MSEFAPRLALVGAAPTVGLARPVPANDRGVLHLWQGGWRRSDEAPEPRRPIASPAATFLGWCVIAALIAALVLPFSLPALVDLIRYLSR